MASFQAHSQEAAMATATAMAMAPTSTAETMALHHGALANTRFCASPRFTLVPLRPSAVNLGNVSSSVSGELPSLGSGREARGACFKRFAKFQQFSQDAADGSAVEGGEEGELEEDDADQYGLI